ncbi:MAG TPA: hypothetical protein VFQ51_05020, partial [Vicinamibacteria bacterium]|nr:hypothetical protein [Vicinamibacteria bacterium]
MAEAAVLHRLVQHVTREVRLRRAEFWGLRGLFVGALAAAVPLVARERFGTAAIVAAVALLAAGGLIGACIGYTRKVPPGEAARLADRGFGFQDRVATALEWADRPDRTPLVDALVTDAVARASQRAERRIVPRLWPWEAKLIPVPLALGLVLALAPPIPFPKAALPNFSASTSDDEETPKERAGQLETDAKQRAPKREDVRRPEMQDRTLAPRAGGGGPTQPGDLAAVFKDTALGGRSPDFNSFLKKGDDRIRMLDQVDKMPDLQRDFTQTQHRMVFQKSKELRGGLRPDQVSPEKLRELLGEMERLGRKGGQGGTQAPWAGDVSEGMDALEGGQSERAMDAMERALSKMRSMEDKGRDGKG